MEKRKIEISIGTIFILLLISFFVYSQINAQYNEQLTQAEFINVLIRVLGMEDRLPLAATLKDKIGLLENLGYAPQGGWNPESKLTKGDTAVVLAKIVEIDIPVGATPEVYIQSLADQGIMTPGRAELPFSLPDLANSINTAAAMPGAITLAPPKKPTPPHRKPVSPTL